MKFNIMENNINNLNYENCNESDFNVIIDESRRIFDDLKENINKANSKAIYLGGLSISFLVFLTTKEIFENIKYVFCIINKKLTFKSY